MQKAIMLLLVCFLAAQNSYGIEPSRKSGISIHFLPQRVASLSGKSGGLSVDPAPQLKPKGNSPVFQNADDLVKYVLDQKQSVIENGVWIITTHPDAYSPEEMKLLEETKAACSKNNILLFTCRASELPNGWKPNQ